MGEPLRMWNFIQRMGSAESKMKGGYHSPMGLWPSLSPYNCDKQFPNFKGEVNKTCRQNYSTAITVRRNSSPSPPPPPPATKASPPPPKKKKRRRRGRRKKGKKPPERQRQLSTNSEDSFIICFEEDGRCQSFDLSDDETIEDLYSSDSTVAQKKVRFADGGELCEVHQMVMWAYAYQAARKGPWEVYARDRERFHQRVVSVEAEIGHVFKPDHRMRIYNERFL